MTDRDYLNHQSPKPPASPINQRIRSAVLIQTEIDEARRDLAEVEVKRDQTRIEELRHLIARLINELQPKLLDPHQLAHGPIRRSGYHQQKKVKE